MASGDWFLFLDTDFYLHPATLAKLLRCLRRGRAAGGGCLIGLDPMPPVVSGVLGLWDLLSRTLRWAAGSFVFCRAEAFREIGGFSTALYAAEEIPFSEALKRWAQRRGQQVVILHKQRHVSSSRKFRLDSRAEMIRLVWRSVVLPGVTLRDRGRLDFFYDGRR